MKQTKNWLALLTLALPIGISIHMAEAQATVSDTFEFRGRLMSTASTPATGTYDLRLSFWDQNDFVDGADRDATGSLAGNTWSETQTVTLDSLGYFIVEVGDVVALPSPMDVTQHKFFMAEVKAAGTTNSSYFLLDPYPGDPTNDRRLIPSTAYAQNADMLDGFHAGNAPNAIPVLDASGQLDPSTLPTTLMSSIGNQTYTEDNFVTDGESLTDSVDALDQAVQNNADTGTANATNIGTNATNIATNTADIVAANATVGSRNYTNNNFVSDGESATASIDALDIQVGINTSAITANSTDIINNTNAISALASGITWKAPVATTADLAANYGTNPADEGISAYVTADDKIYTLDGTGNWIVTGGGTVPNATTSLAGVVTLSGNGAINSGVVQGTDSRLAQVATNTVNIAENGADISTINSSIGGKNYTNDNFVTDGEAVTDSIDALDTQAGIANLAIGTNTAGIATNTANITTLSSNLGNQTYTEDNFVTDGETTTASLDALDQAVADNADSIAATSGNMGTQIYTEDNYVTDGEVITNSVDVLDIKLKDVEEIVNTDFDVYVLP